MVTLTVCEMRNYHSNMVCWLDLSSWSCLFIEKKVKNGYADCFTHEFDKYHDLHYALHTSHGVLIIFCLMLSYFIYIMSGSYTFYDLFPPLFQYSLSC